MWSLAHAPTMLVREPAQERKQKLKNELYRMQKKMGRSFSHRHWRPLTRPGLAPVARYRIGALGWCFASPLDVFRHCQS